ncbi:acyl carrier protein [Salinarimonas soli]|uniref:Acyl carrier protein n=1 Tax=Salinarimonas soli TaxID=1638099 RepID=A0A5B2W0D3_9HYPH|nr:acyl carrier protein [Salinarimonas soli]KAA2244398.1 acyl carrier protein [Salinarimonas soli]
MLVDDIRRIIAETLELSVEEVPADAEASRIEKWDSLAQINICMTVQGTYGIDMSVEEITDTLSVPGFVELVRRKAPAAQAG